MGEMRVVPDHTVVYGGSLSAGFEQVDGKLWLRIQRRSTAQILVDLPLEEVCDLA
jgi:fructose-1-phosphate kinase PfkB-like protein